MKTTIFLASQANLVLDTLLPYLEKKPNEYKVAFVSTASNIYSHAPWMAADKKKLIEIGFEIVEIDIAGKTRDELTKLFRYIDIIFVAGGNTSYLLEQAQLSGFFGLVKQLVNNGIIYIGSSAGAMLACPSIEIDKIYDEGEFGKVLRDYTGLGFVDFVLIPHADVAEYRPYLDQVFAEYGDKFDLRKLDNNQAVLLKDGEIIWLNATKSEFS